MIHKNTRVVSEKSGDILRAAVLGEIDHHGAAGLRDELDELICASRPKKWSLTCPKWILWTVRDLESSWAGTPQRKKSARRSC